MAITALELSWHVGRSDALSRRAHPGDHGSDSRWPSAFSFGLVQAEAALRWQHEVAVERGKEVARGAVAFRLGWVLRVQGRVESAARMLREALAVAVLHEADARDYLIDCLAEQAHCAALVGDAATAETMLEEAEVGRDGSFGPAEEHLVLAEIWAAVARGESSFGLAEAQRWAERAGSMDLIREELSAWHEVARLGAPRRAAERLHDLAHRIEGRLWNTCVRHVEALCNNDGRALDAVSLTFEALGAVLWAAEAAAEAAREHGQSGRKGSALTSAARAKALAGRCEGAITPALVELDPLPLTRREREVAALAARGLSNGEIAERLVISVRTVDNHLHSSYAKLGIASRDQLPPMLQSAPTAAGPRISRCTRPSCRPAL